MKAEEIERDRQQKGQYENLIRTWGWVTFDGGSSSGSLQSARIKNDGMNRRSVQPNI